MRIHYLLIIAILFISTMFYSCVDEPTIPEVKRPYSSLRLGNFADNVNTLNITIDGTSSYTISKDQLTEHFDIESGARNFVITDEGGNEILDKDITISAFEEVSLLFSGYSDSDELNNTFGEYPYTEGEVYIYNGPNNQDTCWVHYFDLISDTPILDSTAGAFEESREFIARAVDMDNPDSAAVDAADVLSFNTVQSVALTPGNKKFLFLIQTSEGIDPTYDTLGVFETNLEGGVRHYLFLTGRTEIDGVNTTHNIEVPLSVRSK